MLNWPVLECPRLAGFEVSPEADSMRTLRRYSGEFSSVAIIGFATDGEKSSDDAQESLAPCPFSYNPQRNDEASNTKID